MCGEDLVEKRPRAHQSVDDMVHRFAALDLIDGQFNALGVELGQHYTSSAVRAFVHLNARRPELIHFMTDAGRHDDDRMRYLVDPAAADVAERHAQYVATLFVS